MSSLYLPDMEMPKEGMCKTITIFDDGAVVEGNGSEKLGIAVPVPDHGRLMDKDAVNLQDGPYEYDEWCEWALDQYMNAPIILPAEKEGE